MPFCHVNVKQEGKVSACWRYPDRIGDYTNESIVEIWNGDKLKTLRKQLLNGERPEGAAVAGIWKTAELKAHVSKLQKIIKR